MYVFALFLNLFNGTSTESQQQQEEEKQSLGETKLFEVQLHRTPSSVPIKAFLVQVPIVLLRDTLTLHRRILLIPKHRVVVV